MKNRCVQILCLVLSSAYLVGCISSVDKGVVSEIEYSTPEVLTPPTDSGYTIEEEHELGVAALEEIRNDSDVVFIEDRRIVEYVTELAKHLISHAPALVPRVPISIYVVHSESSFPSGAMTIIGGNIFLQIKNFAQKASEDSFATQLSHEIGHVLLRHSGRWETQRAYFRDYMEKRKATSDMDPQAPPLTAGDQHQFELYLMDRILISEDEADIFAVQLAVASGYDPHEYMRDLAQHYSFPGFMTFLNRHRSGHERAALMEREFQNSTGRMSSSVCKIAHKRNKRFDSVRDIARNIVRTHGEIQ